MVVSYNWLKSLFKLNEKITEKEFCNRMTEIGMAVENVEHVGAEISGVVVGKVTELSKHPNADKLFVTKIDVGRGEPLQIVTGADNLYVGAFVPVALDGSVLANGVKIKKGKLRGEISDGMLCSIEELGFSKWDFPEAPENGIYIYNQAVEVGADGKTPLELEQTIIDFDLTSNRPDCYSVLGLAREAAAAFGVPLQFTQPVVAEKADGNVDDIISVEIKNPSLCPRYAARAVKNVKIAPSPQWLRRRLTSCGIRPINNIVDITNYVMLELGQPMHAFDVDTIAERKIIVRNAENGEKFVTLDGNERTLDKDMLVIADAEKAVAIAGIMGGENSKITGTAEAVLFESANFDGTNIRRTSKKLGLRTESSSKYERGIDPNLALLAVNRAAELVELLGCGEVLCGVADCYPNKRESYFVDFYPQKINKLLGTKISDMDMTKYLGLLQISTKNTGEGKYTAQIPTFRYDLKQEADIAEEIARLFGYDNIPSTENFVGGRTTRQKMEDKLKTLLCALGFNEMLSFAFESPKVLDKLLIPKESELRQNIEIQNPLGEDFSIMRTSTLNAVLSSLAANYRYGNEDSYLFEFAKTYIPKKLPLAELPHEIKILTLGAYGENCDFFEIKGIIETIFANFGVKNKDVQFKPSVNLPFAHPGRFAEVFIDGENIGFFGEVHPKVAENYEISTRVYVSALELEKILKKANDTPVFAPLPKFQASYRDAAFLVDENVAAGAIFDTIFGSGVKICEDVAVFDVYTGEKLPKGKKSIAFRLTFRADDKTLTEEEINKGFSRILSKVEKKTGAVLRLT